MSASHPNLELNNPSDNFSHSSSNSSTSSQLANEEDMSTLKILSAYKSEDKCDGDSSPSESKNPNKLKGSLLVKNGEGRNVKQMEAKHSRSHQFGAEKTSEDLSCDIDFALAEVMSGIHSLGLRHGFEVLDDFNHTPDLVIGLPQASSTAQQSSPKKSLIDESSILTTAEVFANADQCTIKKGISAHKAEKQPGKTDDAILRNPSFSEKKYATLGRIDAKKLKESGSTFRQTFACERNTFGKPKPSMSSTMRQHSMVSASIQPSIIPPARTSSCASSRESASNRILETSSIFRPGGINTLDSRHFRSTAPTFNVQPISSLPERRISSPDSVQSNESRETSRQSSVSSNSSLFLPDPQHASQRNLDQLFRNKPAVKAKPPLMKKPTRVSEVGRKPSDSHNPENLPTKKS